MSEGSVPAPRNRRVLPGGQGPNSGEDSPVYPKRYGSRAIGGDTAPMFPGGTLEDDERLESGLERSVSTPVMGRRLQLGVQMSTEDLLCVADETFRIHSSPKPPPTRRALTFRKKDVATELRETVDLLHEKEEDLRIAAEVGTALLHCNKNLIAEHEEEVCILRRKITSQANAIIDLERQLEERDGSLTGIDREQYKEMRSRLARVVAAKAEVEGRCQLLEGTIRELENANISLSDEVGKHEEDVARVLAEAHSARDLREEVQKLQAEIEELEREEEVIEEREASLRILQKKTQAEKDRFESVVRTQEAELEAKHEECDSLRTRLEKMRRADSQQRLAELDTMKEELERLGEAETERKRLDTLVRTQQQEIDRLRDERDESVGIIDDLRHNATLLRDALADKDADTAEKTPQHEEQYQKESIFDELAAAIRADGPLTACEEEHTLQTSEAPSISTASPLTSRKKGLGSLDARQEFFFLCVMAVKMKRITRDKGPGSGAMLDSLSSISPSQMYRTCLDREIPFHEWYDWIVVQVNQHLMDTQIPRDAPAPPSRRSRVFRGRGALARLAFPVPTRRKSSPEGETTTAAEKTVDP